MYRFIHPKTKMGKSFHFLLVSYLSLSLFACTPPRPEKPPSTIARAMETRSYSGDLSKVLKASINALQDMNYTIDVLNSDVGLITASRTTEQEHAVLDNEKAADELSGFQKLGVLIFFAVLLAAISGGESSNNGWNRGNDKEKGPVVYRYRVTVNLNELNQTETQIRVSATGESEQDGSILQTGGVHEPEFFQKFFANVNKALFLE
ncbi:MAG: hypothetical protein CMF83_02055 [Candidatus Marinimicrobia bacterium]|nr:hypothetical protein [Candidatus Neomarinimicrobiota bacterium]